MNFNPPADGKLLPKLRNSDGSPLNGVAPIPIRTNAGKDSVGPKLLEDRPSIGKDHDGLKAALDGLSIGVRLNTRNQRIEYNREGLSENEKVSYLPIGQWQAQTKHIDAAIRAAILDNFKFHNSKDDSHVKWGRESYEENINSVVFGLQVDPFKEWLEALPPWDNENRLDGIWESALGVDAGNLEYSAARFLIAAVARTYDDSFQHDYMPILVGAQGTGKSTFCREPVPHGDGWFVDGLDLAASPKELTESTMGAVIVEFSELVGIRRADVERLKTYLSQRQVTIRLSYRRNSGTYPRQWVPLGTANNDGSGVLPEDRSGHRRFVIIDVPPTSTPQHVKDYLEQHRNHLWAEALARYQAKEPTHLNPEDEAAASEKATGYVVHNAAVEDAAARLTEKANGKGQSMTDLLIEAQLCRDVSEAAKQSHLQRNLAGALLEMGWEKERPTVNGRRKWLWNPPPLHETCTA